MRLAIINSNLRTRNYHITLAIFKAAKRVLGEHNVVLCDYTDVLENVCSQRFDCLLVLDGQHLNSYFIERAKRYVDKVHLWSFDDPYDFNSNERNQHLFDHVFSNDPATVKQYKVSASYLPVGAGFPSDYGVPELPDSDRDIYDVAFAGSAWPNRVETLNGLINARPALKYDIKLAYNKHVPDAGLPLPPSDYIFSASFQELLRSAHQSKCIIYLHRNFSVGSNSSKSVGIGPRFFELARAGAFQLIDLRDLEPAWTSFPHIELIGFTSEATMLAKLDYFLDNPDERRRISADIAHYVAGHHSFDVAIGALEALVDRTQTASKAAPRLSPLQSRTRLPRVLFVAHNLIVGQGFGGLEIHMDILKDNLKGKFEIYFFCKDTTRPGASVFHLRDSSYNIIKTYVTSIESTHGLLANNEIESAFSNALAVLNPKIVHFFHFMNNVPSLALIASASEAKVVISVHDFFTSCRRFNLLDHTNKYCENTYSEVEQCDICLNLTMNLPKGSQTARRGFFSHILTRADSLVFVSESARDITFGIYPQLSDNENISIIGAPLPHRLSGVRTSSRPPRLTSEPAAAATLKVVFLGNLDIHKGADHLIQAMQFFKGRPVSFDVYGFVPDALIKRIERMQNPNVTLHGSYEPGSLNISNFDVSLHLSTWPETYCQTLSEAWAQGIVPIVTDIGALGERVVHGVNGFKYDFRKPQHLVRQLSEIIANPEILTAITENPERGAFLTQTQHADKYFALYSDLSSTLQPSDAQADVGNYDVQFDASSIGYYIRRKSWNNNPSAHPVDEIVIPQRAPDPIPIRELKLTDTAFYVERMLIDDSRQPVRTHIITPDKKMQVSGWLLDAKSAAGDGRFAFAIQSAQSKELLSVGGVNAIERADVAERFGLSGVCTAGFALDLNPAQFGSTYGALRVLVGRLERNEFVGVDLGFSIFAVKGERTYLQCPMIEFAETDHEQPRGHWIAEHSSLRVRGEEEPMPWLKFREPVVAQSAVVEFFPGKGRESILPEGRVVRLEIKTADDQTLLIDLPRKEVESSVMEVELPEISTIASFRCGVFGDSDGAGARHVASDEVGLTLRFVGFGL